MYTVSVTALGTALLVTHSHSCSKLCKFTPLPLLCGQFSMSNLFNRFNNFSAPGFWLSDIKIPCLLDMAQQLFTNVSVIIIIIIIIIIGSTTLGGPWPWPPQCVRYVNKNVCLWCKCSQLPHFKYRNRITPKHRIKIAGKMCVIIIIIIIIIIIKMLHNRIIIKSNITTGRADIYTCVLWYS